MQIPFHFDTSTGTGFPEPSLASVKPTDTNGLYVKVPFSKTAVPQTPPQYSIVDVGTSMFPLTLSESKTTDEFPIITRPAYSL